MAADVLEHGPQRRQGFAVLVSAHIEADAIERAELRRHRADGALGVGREERRDRDRYGGAGEGFQEAAAGEGHRWTTPIRPARASSAMCS